MTDGVPMPKTISRRTALLGGLTGLAGAVAACAAPGATPAPAAAPASVRLPAAAGDLAALEARWGGRLGVHAADTGSGFTVSHRGDERFLMCSTSKALTVANLLHRAAREPDLLGRIVRYPSSRLIAHSPVTAAHVAAGLSVKGLCEAAITQSDNTAENLLLDASGGSGAVTEFVRTLGDPVTRLDRTEPELNVSAPGDERDTSTPARMSAALRSLVLQDALDPAGRELLIGWLVACTTGVAKIRAGLPAGWRVGDKTGSGARAEANDIAVVWPPGRAPWMISVFTVPDDPASTAGDAIVAAAARVVAAALTDNR